MADDRHVAFSERYGYVHRAIQIESMDTALKNGLWNALHRLILVNTTRPSQKLLSVLQLMRHIWIDHFKETEESLSKNLPFLAGRIDPAEVEELRSSIKYRFYTTDWYRAYDLIEFVGQNIVCNTDQFRLDCNFALERERAGYRFVNRLIAPITNDLEIEAIESAISQSEEPAVHLRRALERLSDRQTPDFSNSMKDSILAVESQARITMGDPAATLGKLLHRLQKERGLPTNIKTAIEALHRYTSSAVGIRHGLVGREKDVNFHMAKFVLVVCSACVNFIAVNAEDS